ncbi:hypothetical protein COW36_18960 [bacterium (Candidatus Blackallbacteria) CG17_big_fil_post_rev_8_21_14_2_50_48_46]|uniref:Uncharacterized protein n=1 Tax=bacterium (Candidatus Blackallbacteria) CG17_big_fil_post_rev_8_21_14_2_50_48_46 TaxID=2014261 RepID=A0A2M7G159_9BACT|nr:MAG: hypothetical protein COW64_25510 [bacterium (Candidatus Blackallbacteria) CG18_big_fil_WC_8_21_14_2_50_49_26]PIW15008.1 MAG: hypothetical protein COW36_18960 [bacterium (Candidatus Blackallbacteria) CG17_big_fil_post_rev_8_21_14_2_50_48_46]PIW50089.1 MAG: hypothetical protein COW20_03895 [bacterium (Candidatus Blackallbacteria) CG13_big_fil_rev_8_21_14_2_50_49_14]
MMLNNLQDLKAAQNRLVQRDDQRQTAARNQFEQARALLQEYNRSLEKQILREVMLMLIGCIRLSRSFPDPYLLLAYIYLSLRLPHLSLKYLKVAEHLQKEHPQIAKLKQALQTNFQAPLVRKNQPGFQIQNLGEQDFDALYEEVLDQVKTEMRSAMEFPLPMGPTCDRSLLAQLHRSGNALSENLVLLQSQIEVLDQEIDCTELRRRIQPLESRVRLIAQVCEQSEQFISLEDMMRQSIQHIEMDLEKTNDQHLEIWLDQCDGFADQLDHFSQKGWEIAPLELTYQNLLELLTALQEKLDSV